MDCPICLTKFETDEALIPELQCNCIFVVHAECWNKWTRECLYCRGQPARVKIIEIRVNPVYETYKKQLLMIGIVYLVIMYIIWYPREPVTLPTYRNLTSEN
jgi:hypothetical protein